MWSLVSASDHALGGDELGAPRAAALERHLHRLDERLADVADDLAAGRFLFGSRPSVSKTSPDDPDVVLGQQIGLPRLQPRLQNSLPELTGIDLAENLVRLRTPQWKHRVIFDGLHECIGDVDAVMQIKTLAVEIAGRLADFEEFLDFRMVDVEINRCRAATQRALTDGQCQPVHDVNERDYA